MTVLRCFPPSGLLDATIEVPGSKSVANRALICAMLADGESIVRGVPNGDDTQVIIDVLTAMSAVSFSEDGARVRGNTQPVLPGIVDAGLAGTSSRFLTAVAAISGGTTLIDGGDPLRLRPMGDLHDALEQLGASIEPLGETGHLPVSVSGSIISGGDVTIRASVSSQFISALMLIGPMVRGGLTIHRLGARVSESYVSMTAQVMSSFGVDVVVNENSIVVPEGRYRPCEYNIEPDFSSAAFPIVACLLRGGQVRIRHLSSAMSQGDAAILDIASRLGATVDHVDGDVVVQAPPNLTSDQLSLSMTDCSDLVPVVAVALTRCARTSSIDGVGFIRHKESDRLGDVADELRKVGAIVEVTDDGLVITRSDHYRGAVLSTHHDHRLAMSFALLSLVTENIAIEDPDVVGKSWPQYFSDMADILGPSTVEN